MDDTLAALLGSALPVNRVLEAIGRASQGWEHPGDGHPERQLAANTVRSYTSRALANALAFDTDYGTLSKWMRFGTDGDAKSLRYLCPFALMSHLSKLQPEFAGLLKKSLGGFHGSIALYVDEVTPGNPLRPDTARKYQAVYWTFLQMPTWLRTRSSAGHFGWFTFAYIPSKEVNVSFGAPRAVFGLRHLLILILGCVFWLGGGASNLCWVLRQDLEEGGISMSHVMREVMKVFWREDEASVYNMARNGCVVPVDGELWKFNADFACVLSDEKALKECFSTKGAAGTKPCAVCSNVVGRATEAVEGLVHVLGANMSRCVPHTAATYEVIMSHSFGAHMPQEIVFAFRLCVVCSF